MTTTATQPEVVLKRALQCLRFRLVLNFLSIICFLLILVPLVHSAESQRSNENLVTNLQIAGDDAKVRIVFNMSAPIAYETFYETAPYRLVVDLHNVGFDLGSDAGRGAPGFLKNLRYGRIDEGTVRIIFETTVPFKLRQDFQTSDENKQNSRLVLDLDKTDETDFKQLLALHAVNNPKKHVPEPDTSVLTGKRAPKGDRQQKEIPLRIVIDPGHGGVDGGATAVGKAQLIEKDVVLVFAKELTEQLKKIDNYAIKLTRTGDDFLTLRSRVEIARDFQAQLFISIHADSFPQDRSVRGATVYTLSDRASDSIAAQIAGQENKSDFIGGYQLRQAPDDVVDILFDLTQRETRELSSGFAKHLVRGLRPKVRFFKRPHQTGAFRVLKVPDIPSALIELGYLSNKKDVSQIGSPKWRFDTAKAMAETIADYLKATYRRGNGL